jgi:hypothetical protein
MRDPALFDLAIDSELAGRDLVPTKISTPPADPISVPDPWWFSGSSGDRFKITVNAEGSLFAPPVTSAGKG